MDRARDVVDALFADLRGRKLLKWLFMDADDQACGPGAYGYVDAPIDLETQADIVSAWQGIITAALSLPRSEEWRDIASAPKGGTRFLAYEDGNYYALEWKQEMPSLDKGYWDPCDSGRYTVWPPEPTHWRPLPPPPQALTTGEGE